MRRDLLADERLQYFYFEGLFSISEGGNLLTQDSLLAHLDVLKEAARVHVDMDDM